MFIAMNRFRIARGKEEGFEEMWRQRDSQLAGVPGFREFHLLRGPSDDEMTLFASHTVWESPTSWSPGCWKRPVSEAFRRAHAKARAPEGTYLGPPRLELFDAVL